MSTLRYSGTITKCVGGGVPILSVHINSSVVLLLTVVLEMVIKVEFLCMKFVCLMSGKLLILVYCVKLCHRLMRC